MFTKTLPGGSFPTTAQQHDEVQAEHSGLAKLRRLRSEFKAKELESSRQFPGEDRVVQKGASKRLLGSVVAHESLPKAGLYITEGQDYLRMTRAAVWLCSLVKYETDTRGVAVGMLEV